MFFNNFQKNDNNKFYNTLGIPKSSNINEIKKAYKRLALKYHPDKNNGDDINLKKSIQHMKYYLTLLKNNNMTNLVRKV